MLFCGMEMSVIKDLGQGFYLAAHPNGPAIANEHTLATLEFCGGEPQIKPLSEDEGDFDRDYRDDPPVIDDEDLPWSIRRAAIHAYVEWSWSLAKVQLEANPAEAKEGK